MITFPKRKNKPGTLYYREASGRISQPRNRILPVALEDALEIRTCF